jgi:hypothetical protein
MKKTILPLLLVLTAGPLLAQKKAQQYPAPEFSNEIYFFNKDSIQAMRLEKGYSKAEAKTKMGGMGGGENAYQLEGSRSPVRLVSGTSLSFIFFSGDATASSAQSDSIMKENGMDPAAMENPMDMLNDPSRSTSLYSMNTEKGSRRITLHSYSGMKILGKSKKESTKYTLSIRKVKQGYYELIVDKPLPRGEYAFLVMDSGMGMDGSSKLFAFGVD